MKKKYDSPKIEILLLDIRDIATDIITLSGDNDVDINDGGWTPFN